MKKLRSQTKQQHALEALEKEQQKLAAIEKEMAIFARQKERRDQANRKRPNIPLIILVMAGVWGLYELQLYYQHHNNHWFLLILSAILAIACSGFLGYCWKKRRVYNGGGLGFRGEWIYRDEDPFLYWCYMALLLFYNGAMIYVFFHLLIKGSV